MMKEFVKDLAIYSPATIIPAIVTIITIPIITRMISPESYGDYVLIVSLISILVTLIGGLSSSIIRFYPIYEKNSNLDYLLNTSIDILIIFIIFMTLSLFMLAVTFKSYFSSRLYNLIILGILLFILNSIFEVLTSYLRVKRQASWYSLFLIFKSVGALIFSLIFIVFFNYDSTGLLLGSILPIALSVPLIWKKSIGNVSIDMRNISFKLAKEMAAYGTPLALGNFANWTLSLSDRYILGFFRSTSEVGIYSISYQLAQSSIFLIAALFNFAFNPLSVIIWEKYGACASKEFLINGTRYFLILCVPAVFGMSILCKEIMMIFTTNDYLEGYTIIPIICLSGLIFGLTQRYAAPFSFFKKSSIYGFCIFASCFLEIGLNIWLIPTHGYLAAALSNLISYGFLLVLVIMVSKRYLAWNFPFRTLMNVILSSAIMGIVIIFIKQRFDLDSISNLSLIIIFGTTLYFSSLLLLKELRPEEVLQIKIACTHIYKKYLK